MKEHRCGLFPNETVRVMNVFAHRGKNSLRHVFPKNISHYSARERHPKARLVYSWSPSNHELYYVNVQEN